MITSSHMPAPRIVVLCLLCLSWLWASSIFTPWAESRDPRLWLYDLLFYARYGLLFWGLGELLFAWQQFSTSTLNRRQLRTHFLLLVICLLNSIAAYTLSNTGLAYRLRVQLSSVALASSQTAIIADQRHRTGLFLIDNQRAPCADQAWLWLGQAHGGGSGTNLALVYSAQGIPLSPDVAAFRFWPLADGWWLAYQNPQAYFARAQQHLACRPGLKVNSHRQGLDFIRAS